MAAMLLIFPILPLAPNAPGPPPCERKLALKRNRFTIRAVHRPELFALFGVLLLAHARAEDGKAALAGGRAPHSGAVAASPKPAPDSLYGLNPLPKSLPLLKVSNGSLAAAGEPVALEELVKESRPYSPAQRKAAIWREVLKRAGKDALSAKPQGDPSSVPQYVLSSRLYDPDFDPPLKEEVRFERVGECLLIAGYLLSRPEPGWRIRGAELAFETAGSLESEDKNSLLVLAICDTYVLPHLDLFPAEDPKAQVIPGLRVGVLWEYQDMVERLVGCYSLVRAPSAKLTRLLQLLLDCTKLKDPLTANHARLQLSALAEESGDLEGAIAQLRDWDSREDRARAEERLQALEEKMRRRGAPKAPQ